MLRTGQGPAGFDLATESYIRRCSRMSRPLGCQVWIIVGQRGKWLLPYLEDWQLGSHVVRSRQSQTGSGRGCKRLTTTRLLGTKACDVGMEMVQHCPQATAVCDCRSEYKASKISTRVPGVHNTQGFVWHGGVLVACPGSSARAQ